MIDLVFLHGFFSSPQSRKIQHFLEILPDTDIAEKIGEYHVINLYPLKQDFEQMTISGLVELIYEQIKSSTNQVILVGSSHGGLLTVAFQRKYPDRLRGMVLLAPALQYYQVLSKRYDLNQWEDRGYLPMEFNRFEGISKLSSKYIENLEKYQNWQDPKIPVLLIHGKKDDLIPVNHSKEYAEKLDHCTEFYPSEGVHHLGNVIEQLSGVFINWLRQILT